MINKSIQPHRNMISSQISIVKKQKTKEDFEVISRKTSLISPIKGQINLKNSSNYFHGKNSIDCQELNSKCLTINKLKSLNVLIKNRKFFISSRNSKQNQQSVSQESIPLQLGKKKTNEFGNRVIPNKINRMSTIQIEEEVKQQSQKTNLCKDPETFTDWVEKIYGKQWFVESSNQ
ncbi:unnamed protein product [Paramecium primaurelia]|uniref:Uncharacterized protein n=1 Tax=Paramecium primaurelia TaxID=5886 RepID=A0A8S1PHY1_PARPR|nr:unnamed protein product [Paramecium primaurelia]